MPRHAVLAVAVVFMLAALSKVTLVTPVGTMRLEQPALFGLIALTIWHRKALDLPPLRPLLPIIVAGLVYLGTLTLSSAVVAMDPGASLRLVAWTALSMVGGLVTALLLAGRAARSITSFTGPAAVVATVGLVSAVAYLLFAIGRPWIDDPLTDMPRIAAFVLEPNLYASLLAAVIPLALERWRARPSLAALAIVLVLLLSVGLGVTRGAYIGLAVGLVVLFGMNWLRSRQSTRLRAVAVIVLLAGGAGLFMPKLLLIEHAGLIAHPPTSGTTNPSPKPTQPPDDELQTFEYRMARVFTGLEDWHESPVIGLGAYSYGQRHITYRIPEVISVWPVLVLHDAGLIGLAGFLALLGLLGLRLWRTSGDSVRGPTANAYAAAVVVLLVAYLATTAVHFAVTWLIFGGALAATIQRPRDDDGPGSAPPKAGPAWRLTAPLTERSRRSRLARFMRLMAPRDDERVLDVGVTDKAWRSSNFLEAWYPWPKQITGVAPARVAAFTATFPDVKFVVADGRDLPFGDAEFDIGFSNAVIEHVGSRDEQRRFAAEITRTCERVFLCTPNRWFPVDPHTLLPFVHWLPRKVRDPLLRATGNAQWAGEELLNPLGARDLARLFPAGTNVRIERQRVLGLTSVLIAVAQRPRT
ncbi:MAG: methyltransferase domain-containing protein [Chloroflexota bacterium]